MSRTVKDYVADILTCFREMQEFTHGIDFDDFARDRKTVNAVVRSLEVPVDMRGKYPEIPWKRMTGMRDKLIHEYFGADLETVWGVVTDELPPLKPLFEQLREDLEKEDP